MLGECRLAVPFSPIILAFREDGMIAYECGHRPAHIVDLFMGRFNVNPPQSKRLRCWWGHKHE